MIEYYHNPRCSKSREGLKYLQGKNIEVSIKEYLGDAPFAIDTLKEVLSKLGVEPMAIVRKSESIYKEKYKGKELSDDELIAAMVENPKLIQRPIVINGEKAVVARPTEAIDTIL